MSEKDLGQEAYEAYCKFVNYQSIHGERLPKWADQSFEIQNAWRSAGFAVGSLMHAGNGLRLYFLTVQNYVESHGAEFAKQERQLKADLAAALDHLNEVDPS